MGSFSVVQWIIVGLIVWGLFTLISRGGGGAPMVCKACGHVGAGQRVTRGNVLIELVLWLCFIIPGLIYSIWRVSSRYDACTACGSRELIPTSSPIGARLLADNAAAAPVPAARDADDQVPGSLAAGMGKRL